MAKLTEEDLNLVDNMMGFIKHRLKGVNLKTLEYDDNNPLGNSKGFCITAVHEDGRVQCLHRPLTTSGLDAKWNANYFREHLKEIV